MRSEVQYGTLLTYSPRGRSEISRRSRTVCYAIKAGDLHALNHAALRLQEHIERQDVLAPFFGPHVTLIPMPRSAPLVQGALWPAQKICEAILARGLAAAVVPALERVDAVARSAHAAQGERPLTSVHFESLRAHGFVDVGASILVVDDVLTKGATALAAVSRLAEVYPDAQIATFALVRTMGLVAEIEQILDPAIGTIRLIDDEVRREP